MAGMLPGVGVPSRRRTIHHHRLEDPSIHRQPSIRERLKPSITSTTTLDMDETALRARRRLEQKLGYFRPSSRSSKFEASEGRGSNEIARTKDTGLGSKILGRAWHFQLNSSKTDREVCAVCLEDFRAEKEVMDLSCSHKYHSKCLLPWLAAHPHCPYCRSPVQS